MAAAASPGTRDARRAMAAAVNTEFRTWVQEHEELAGESGPLAAATEALTDLAEGLTQAGADAAGVIAAARSALELQRAARRAARGLGRAAAAYQPPDGAARPFRGTDFEAVLAGVSARVDGGDDGDVGAAVAALLDALTGDAPAAAGGDDDVVPVAGMQLAKNERCPVTGKNILALDNPVTDAHGFVYEQAAVIEYIRTHGRAATRGAPKQVKCPVAGTDHFVTEAGLKVATRVVRAAAQAGGRRRGGRAAADVHA